MPQSSEDGLTACFPTNQPPDYTLIVRREHLPDLLGRSLDRSRRLRIDGDDARLQIVSCFEQKAISVTVRGKENDRFKEGMKDLPKAEGYRLISRYKPSPECIEDALNSVHEISQVVYDVLTRKESRETHGFLIVSGTTNSLKTKLALGLIHMYLEARMIDWLKSDRIQRKPHLVTCEDDVEKYFVELDRLQPLETLYQDDCGTVVEKGLWLSNPWLPDYTPRQKFKDVRREKLDYAVESALRMTPSVFYAGEIRAVEDWKSLYRLAQSHLVVLTTHASGLVNTFEILQNRLEIKTPGQKSELAAATFAVVHVRTGPLLKHPGEASAPKIRSIIPTCWVQTPMSVSNYTSDGLASLVGQHADLIGQYKKNGQAEQRELPYAVGRRAFAEVLLELAKFNKVQLSGPQAPHLKKWKPLKEQEGDKPEPIPPGSPGESDEVEIHGRENATSLDSGEGERFVRQAMAWDLRGE